jgi:type IX secretion system PorP/SprF family membrane protein
MKKLTSIIILLFCVLVSRGQQDPLSSQYAFNPFIINSAYAGYSRDFNAWASYRMQWAGIDGAPETKSISAHTALLNNRMGLGFLLLQDKIGNDKNTQAVASYAYHLLLDGSQKISFGLRGGFSNYRLNYDELQIDETDPKFQSTVSEFSPVIGAGFIYSSDKMFLGFSIPNMLEASQISGGVETSLYNQHAYAQAAYLLQLSPRIKVKPFLLARAVRQAPINLDFGAILSADDSYSIGLFTRKLHTYGVLAKMHIGDALRLGYIFELPTNKSVGLNYATHEFTIGIRMAFLKSHDLQSIVDF